MVPGIRVFGVKIEGADVMDGLDLTAAVGFATACEFDFDVDAAGPTLDVEFVPIIENPKVSAIEVLRQVHPDLTLVIPLEYAPELFIRGDPNFNGRVGISDAVAVLRYLFSDRPIACADAADADDSGGIKIGDAVSILLFLFGTGNPPAAPFPSAGTDPTADGLGCEAALERG